MKDISEMTPVDWLINMGISVIPPILVGLLFYIVMRAIFRADSKERKVYSDIEAQERAKRAKKPNA